MRANQLGCVVVCEVCLDTSIPMAPQRMTPFQKGCVAGAVLLGPWPREAIVPKDVINLFQ